VEVGRNLRNVVGDRKVRFNNLLDSFMELTSYSALLEDIKARIRKAQIKATLAANAEMISMYADIGMMIQQRQQKEGWSAGVIPKLAQDLKNDLPAIKGFSERNLGYMLRFSKEYSILQQAVAKLDYKQFAFVGAFY
jgi:predicted nuclease of restriction endonuclease-like (RecB) superfamily